MTGPRFHSLFGGPPRRPESPLTQREMDLAASVQAATEEVMLRAARHLHRETGMKNLVLAGGVALNCVGNGRVLREGPFDNIWIQPAAGDAGGALGTAQFIWHQLLDHPRRVSGTDGMQGSLLGPHFDDDQIATVLDAAGARYTTHADDESLCAAVSTMLADEKVVGWFQGRMEFGPRALGNRSILGDARSPRMQTVMNLKIKFRESFRPFAPLVLREEVDRYFQMRPFEDSPYMLLVAPVREEHRVAMPPEADGAFGIEKLRYARSTIPAVTHVDHSARVQTVDDGRNPLLHRLLTAFHRRTGCPVLVNTSFNVRGEPIVCTPEDALRCFLATDMDVLVMGRSVVLKSEQARVDAQVRREHLAQFQLD
jgi:carbamoyltransferase